MSAFGCHTCRDKKTEKLVRMYEIAKHSECLYFWKIIAVKGILLLVPLRILPLLWIHLLHSCPFLKQYWESSCMSTFNYPVRAASVSWVSWKYFLPWWVWLRGRARSHLVSGAVNKVDDSTQILLWACLSVRWHQAAAFALVLSHFIHTSFNNNMNES